MGAILLFLQGVELLKKSCDMNNATACFYLSGMHISGVQHTDKDDTVATASVDIHHMSTVEPAAVPSITTVGTADFLIQRDMAKAFQFAYKACELRNMYACANLSQMYARGDGTEKDTEKADKFKKIALEMQEEVKNQPTLGFQQGIL